MREGGAEGHASDLLMECLIPERRTRVYNMDLLVFHAKTVNSGNLCQ